MPANTPNRRFTMIDRRQITHDHTFRHRTGDDSPTHLAALRKTLRNTGSLDPIIVWQEISKDEKETGRLVLLDGHYRVAAYRAEQHEGRVKGQGIPSMLLKGSRIDAELAALAANVKDTLPLTPHERMNAAWLLVMRYRNNISKSRLSRASGTAPRTIANMRQQLRKFDEAKAVPSGDWLADRKFPEENEWTPPSKEEKKVMIDNMTKGFLKVLEEVRTNDMEIIGDALINTFGARGFQEIADFYFGPEADDERDTSWMAPDDFEQVPDGEPLIDRLEEGLTMH